MQFRLEICGSVLLHEDEHLIPGVMKIHTPPSDQHVLLVAYGCEPGRGSEPGLGWAHAMHTARRRPVHILTHPDHRLVLDETISQWNRRGDYCPMSATYIDISPALRRLASRGLFGFNVYYKFWCRAAARAAVTLHHRFGFSLTQHVSLCRWWMPSPAAAVAAMGVPFIWGPLAAGETVPLRYRGGLTAKSHATEISRWLARSVFSLDPGLRRCAKLATLGVAEPDETVIRLAALGVSRIERAVIFPCDAEQMHRIVPMPKPPGVFRVVSGGGLVYWKAFHLAVRAFAKAFGTDPNVEYVHVCDGREANRLRREAAKWGITDRLYLVGEMPHLEGLRWVKSADMYVLPTLRDTAGQIFDALAAGVPVLTTDHLTPRVIVNETCGQRVSLTGGPMGLVSQMADTMRLWRDDPVLRQRLCEGAIRQANEHSAEAFERKLHYLQDQAIGYASNKPAAKRRCANIAAMFV